jgi:hypothetical protein
MGGGELLEIRLLNNHLLDTFGSNQLLDTKFINCPNPVNPGSTGSEHKKVTNGQHCRAVDTSSTLSSS